MTILIFRELLFQSLSDQLLAAYSESTPFPFGSVISQIMMMLKLMMMMIMTMMMVMMMMMMMFTLIRVKR